LIDKENLKNMSADEKEKFLQDSSLIRLKLDDYELPSLMIKFIKSMKKNEVSELVTDKIEKLTTNFKNQFFD